MPTLKINTIRPTPEEDLDITAVALSDPDAIPFSEEEWQVAKPSLQLGAHLNSSQSFSIPTFGFDGVVNRLNTKRSN